MEKRRWREPRAMGIAEDRLVLLSPGTADDEVEEVVPEAEIDDPGTGKRIGTAVGRGIGIAGELC